jgi:hypothetical protein
MEKRKEQLEKREEEEDTAFPRPLCIVTLLL